MLIFKMFFFNFKTIYHNRHGFFHIIFKKFKMDSDMKIIYKNNKKKLIYRQVCNVVITFILVVFCAFSLKSNSDYVFSYNNTDVIYNGNRNSNNISLMINVYWGNEFIEEMLNILQQYNIISTFFIGGSWAEKYPNILKLIFEKGHEIGNHGYFHKNQNKLSYEQNLEEINACNKMIESIIDTKITLFAPPSGAFNKSTLLASSKLGCLTIMWSKDTVDWRDKDANIIFKRATNGVIGGDLILMHPTQSTLIALPSILDFYKMNNLNATTVSNTISTSNNN